MRFCASARRKSGSAIRKHLYSWYGSKKALFFPAPQIKTNRTKQKHARNSEAFVSLWVTLRNATLRVPSLAKIPQPTGSKHAKNSEAFSGRVDHLEQLLQVALVNVHHLRRRTYLLKGRTPPFMTAFGVLSWSKGQIVGTRKRQTVKKLPSHQHGTSRGQDRHLVCTQE